jgi:hypothetical protein
MPSSPPAANTCPRCHSDAQVKAKLVLIGRASPRLLFPDEERAGYRRRDQLAIDECSTENLQKAPLQQFVPGFYCHVCGVGFVTNSILK